MGRSFIHSFIRPSVRPFVCPSIHPFIHPSIHRSIHSFIFIIHASIHTCIHSFIQWSTRRTINYSRFGYTALVLYRKGLPSQKNVRDHLLLSYIQKIQCASKRVLCLNRRLLRRNEPRQCTLIWPTLYYTTQINSIGSQTKYNMNNKVL